MRVVCENNRITFITSLFVGKLPSYKCDLYTFKVLKRGIGMDRDIHADKDVTHVPQLQYFFIFQVEAGQYCTFVVSSDGGVRSCGKGSYGRLGLGDSNNQTSLKALPFDSTQVVRKLSSSKGMLFMVVQIQFRLRVIFMRSSNF